MHALSLCAVALILTAVAYEAIAGALESRWWEAAPINPYAKHTPAWNDLRPAADFDRFDHPNERWSSPVLVMFLAFAIAAMGRAIRYVLADE